METSGAAKVAARITVEAANTPAVIVEAGQLNEILEFEEAAQVDPEQEQLNNGFPESNKKQISDQLFVLVNLTDIQTSRERDYKGILRVLGSKVKLLHTPYPWE